MVEGCGREVRTAGLVCARGSTVCVCNKRETQKSVYLGDTSKPFKKNYDVKPWDPPPSLRVMAKVADSHTWT